MENPFVTKAYLRSDLFCDREKELELLMRYCVNRSDVTLISQRRLGKTGLILRLFDEIEHTCSDILTLYVDIFASRNIDDFIRFLAEAAIRAFKPRTTIGDQLMELIKSLRPQLTFDTITGEPKLQIAYQNPQEKEFTLQGILDFLNRQDTHIIIAIDEFQQIREYPEQNFEALLRTHIQHTHNLSFIFCGSKKHLMTDIFANERNPFYASTAFVGLGKIPFQSYAEFIKRHFTEANREIDDEAINFILDWTKRHTYYTQQLCHTIFANGAEHIDLAEVKRACGQVMQQYEAVYLQYRQILTRKQWDFIIAVAKEGEVRQLTAADFLGRYKLGSASSASRLAEALCKKGIINDEITPHGTIYSLNDVFLSRWLERL